MPVNFVASWRPGAEKFYSADPQKVAEEVYDLGENPSTDSILEMAKNEDTEMHKCIEWDDCKAAHQYRLEQVRQVMQDLRIIKMAPNEHEKPSDLKVPLRMFYHLDTERGYRPTPIIMKDESLHNKLLMTAKSELQAFAKKYAILSELDPVFEAIKKIA